MKLRAWTISLPAAGALALIALRAESAGFQLQEQTVSGLGLAYSGMPAAAQDAGTAFWNPAAMSLLHGANVAVAAHLIDTSFEFTSAGSTYDQFGDGGDAGGGTWIPALYGTIEINPRVAIGLAIDAPFGLKTDWDIPWAGEFHAAKSEVETLNVNPTAAFRINEHVSLGFGIGYQQIEATLTTAVTPLLPTALGKLDGDDWAFGWNVGALFEIDQSTRIGVTYRSAIDYSISGDLTFDDPALSPNNADIEADLELPDTVAVGFWHEFASGMRVLVDYTWTGWDSVQSLTVVEATSSQPVSVIALNFENSWRAGVGLEYPLNAKWLLRAGAALDRTPVEDRLRTPKLPDEDRRWLAFGARFAPGEQWTIDAGYAHLWVDDASSELAPPGPVPGALIGEYDSSSDIFGVQASFRWR
jgi:long-chain fatty acid transport protein